MTIWSTHLELTDGCSLLKRLPPLDDLFHFEDDPVDRTVNWAENAPSIFLQDLLSNETDSDDEDDDYETSYQEPSDYDSGPMADWRIEALERLELEEGEIWMSTEFERRRLAAPKNLRPGLVKRARNRLLNVRAERILNEDRHWRLRVRVFTDAEKLRAAHVRLLVCNADFGAHVKRCLRSSNKLQRAA